jgi:hypothetical protein
MANGPYRKIVRPVRYEARTGLEHRDRNFLFCAAFACFAVAAIFRQPAFCLWKRLLGFPCPGCGLTRAFLLLSRLRFAEAVARNILTVPFLISVSAVLFCFIADLFFHKRRLRSLGAALTSKPAIAAAAVLAILSWGYNIAVGN